MKNKDFVVFIMSHGRADNVITYKTLKEQGYTGKIVIVIDTDDKQGDEYKRRFGEENVAVFNKDDIAKRFDEIIRGDKKTIVYARNACFDIAEKMGYRFFLELDDDYEYFCFCYNKEGNALVRSRNTRKLDDIFDVMVDFLKEAEQVSSIAFAQGGDFIGGNRNRTKPKVSRKCMNSFFCDTRRRFWFLGRINEDVNTYTTLGSRGKIFLTTYLFSLNQKQTQANKGGMSDVYNESGTYLKSFFSVIGMPSAVKISDMGKNKRIHHNVQWKNSVPCIIREDYKKKN